MASTPQGSCSRPPVPSPQRAPLTLDLLVDHQGEVVHLQDVRELAQRVRQVDLEEKPWSVLTRAAQLGRSPRKGAQGSRRG